MDSVSVSTNDWRPGGTVVSYQRLGPQVSVPSALIKGELTPFTGRVQVSVLDADDLVDCDGHHCLAMLEELRAIGADSPVGTATNARPRGRALCRRLLRRGAQPERLPPDR